MSGSACVGRRISDVLHEASHGTATASLVGGTATHVAQVLHDTGERPRAWSLSRPDGHVAELELTWRAMDGGRRQLVLRDVSERTHAENVRRDMEVQLAHCASASRPSGNWPVASRTTSTTSSPSSARRPRCCAPSSRTTVNAPVAGRDPRGAGAWSRAHAAAAGVRAARRGAAARVRRVGPRADPAQPPAARGRRAGAPRLRRRAGLPHPRRRGAGGAGVREPGVECARCDAGWRYLRDPREPDDERRCHPLGAHPRVGHRPRHGQGHPAPVPSNRSSPPSRAAAARASACRRCTAWCCKATVAPTSSRRSDAARRWCWSSRSRRGRSPRR